MGKKKKKSQGRKQEKETEEIAGEEGAHTYTQVGREASRKGLR